MLNDHWDSDSNSEDFWPDPGQYLGKVTSVKQTTFKSGNQGLVVDIACYSNEQRIGKATRNFVLTEKAMGFLVGFAKSLGITKDQAEKIDPFDVSTCEVFIGRPVIVNIDYQEGSEYREIKRFIKYSKDTEIKQPAKKEPAAKQELDDDSGPFPF